MNQKEFDACWAAIRAALNTRDFESPVIIALRKLEIECRIDRSLLEVRTVIDHQVAEEKQTAHQEHFEFGARRLRMWLEFARDNGDLLIQITPGEREWLAAEIKRPLGADAQPMQRGRRTPKALPSAIENDFAAVRDFVVNKASLPARGARAGEIGQTLEVLNRIECQYDHHPRCDNCPKPGVVVHRPEHCFCGTEYNCKIACTCSGYPHDNTCHHGIWPHVPVSVHELRIDGGTWRVDR